MTPDIGSRLKTLMSSMSAVVIPAIDQDNATANEQAQLILASLELIAGQIDYLHPYEVVNTKALLTLNEQAHLIAGMAVGDEATSAAKIVDNPLSSTEDIRQAGNALRSCVVELIEGCDDKYAAAIQQAVFDYEKSQSVRDRVFVSGTNFDVEAGSLPTMEDALKV